MVLNWFRADDGVVEISGHLRMMLADARHSFDLAMSAVLAGADADAVLEEVRATDRRINESEQEIRRRLLVHAVVQGSGDIDNVLALLMLSRKIERIGDQAKNILDLSVEGVDLVDAPDADELRTIRDQVSLAFDTASRILDDDKNEDAEAFKLNMAELSADFESHLRSLLHSTDPASEAVPRALLFRYLKRTVANLGGVASTVTDPFDLVDYAEGDVDD